MNKIKITTLKISHSYFKNNAMPGLSLIPDEDTEKFFKRYQIEVDRHESSFSLFYLGINKNFLANIELLLDNKPLNFTLSYSGKNFSVITELPSSLLGNITYTAEKNIAGELTPDFKGPKSYNGSIADISIKSEYICPKAAASDYCINFKCRKVQWNYYIIKNKALKLHNSKIVGKDYIFSNSESIQLPSGEQALHFSSGEQLLPLQQYYENSFDLIDNLGHPSLGGNSLSALRVKTLITSLPTPKTNKITVTADKKFLRSEMYVYL